MNRYELLIKKWFHISQSWIGNKREHDITRK